MSAGNKIGRKKEAVIAALLTARTHADAAKAVGISEATLQRWLRVPDFQESYRAARRRLLDAALGRLASLVADAVDTLQQCLAAPKFADKIRAANVILTHGKDSELQDLVAEVAALKEGLKHGHHRQGSQGRVCSQVNGASAGTKDGTLDADRFPPITSH